MNNRKKGTKYETIAAEYLQEQGYKILAKNFRSYNGEIDIVASENSTLVFVEVKYRKDKEQGYAEEAVNIRKQRVIYKVAKYYLLKNGISENYPCRFDVIAVNESEIRLIKNAFGGF